MMALTEKQMDAVYRAIHPLEPVQQEAFLAALNNLYAEQKTVGDGELYRTLRELQKIHMDGAYPTRTPEVDRVTAKHGNRWHRDSSS
jgi:hypothetical protein